MGAGTYDAHMPNQHIEELGYFVQVGIAKEAAYSCDAGIVIGCLFGIGFGVDVHGAELEAGERSSKETHSFLDEENRAARVELDQDKKDGEEPAEDEKNDEQRADNIENTLG
jgi:hypothetical protein